jgi:hypothetical protein
MFHNFYLFYYICNFYSKEEGIKCYELVVEEYDQIGITNKLVKYVNYCEEYTKFYLCEKINNLMINQISYKTICPSKFDAIFNIVISFFLIILDIFCFSFPWFFEFYFCNELIYTLFPSINTINHNNINQSLKETNNTSKVNNDNDNQDNNQNFQKQLTETIIVDNNNNNISCNITNIHQSMNKDEINKSILSINKVKINNYVAENFIIRREITNGDISKTDKFLMNNNNDIIKIINYNIKSKKNVIDKSIINK